MYNLETQIKAVENSILAVSALIDKPERFVTSKGKAQYRLAVERVEGLKDVKTTLEVLQKALPELRIHFATNSGPSVFSALLRALVVRVPKKGERVTIHKDYKGTIGGKKVKVLEIVEDNNVQDRYRMRITANGWLSIGWIKENYDLA